MDLVPEIAPPHRVGASHDFGQIADVGFKNRKRNISGNRFVCSDCESELRQYIDSHRKETHAQDDC
jgi:hypothetical protein